MKQETNEAVGMTNELIVTIRKCGGWIDTEYQGNRAQLEAEGVIPEGTEWPDGDSSVKWEAGRFTYRLRRTRPDGMKGPKKLWVEADWWALRWDTTEPQDYAANEIKRKTKELADTIYRRSPRGCAEWSANWNRYCKALEDKKFQAFKALIPALVPTKRGRRSTKNAATV
ncbi:MAG: hypothetical protein V4448_02880 [Pseudomonadota bacterium]